MEILIPQRPMAVMAALQAAGHQAWAVGGCIRDCLLGRQPHDWDIATGATPVQAKAALAGMKTIDTGVKHGTITALVDGEAVEVTTFRTDGEYSDGRRPDSVAFARDIEEDLARRDFTINAMAWDGHRLADPFGGRQDLQNGVIRAVGQADVRFEEDGLRIMRALRFAAVLGFGIDSATAAAMARCSHMLGRVAAERIRAELLPLLTGPKAEVVLREHVSILGVIIPEIIPTVQFDQRNSHHIYDVWEHTLVALGSAPPVEDVRLALLLHDLGKPRCFSVDRAGVGHFYGHGQKSCQMAAEIMARLRFDSRTRDRVLRLVKYHDSDLLPSEKSLRRWLARLGQEELELLIAVKRADNLAQNPKYHGRQQELDRAEELLARLAATRQCLGVGDLAVNGHDMQALGAAGPQVGRLLRALVEEVLSGRVDNNRQALLLRARAML